MHQYNREYLHAVLDHLIDTHPHEETDAITLTLAYEATADMAQEKEGKYTSYSRSAEIYHTAAHQMFVEDYLDREEVKG